MKLHPRFLTASVFLVVLSGQIASPSRVRAADVQAASSASADYEAFIELLNRKPPKPFEQMTRRESMAWTEEKSKALISRGTRFMELHPTDPLRWKVAFRLTMTGARFVREWGPDDTTGDPTMVVDEAAAAAWESKRAALEAALKQATDLPDEVKQQLAKQEQAYAQYLMETAKDEQALANRWASGREMAPDFTVQDLEGGAVKLSDFRGKTVVLDFWATWCTPCRAAMPHNQEVAARYKDQNVVVVAVSVWESKEKLSTWMKANQAHFPDIVWLWSSAGRGEGDPAGQLYGLTAIPCQFIINPEGRVVATVSGYLKGEVLLEAALAKAGIKVDPALVAQGAEDLKKRRERK